jgi:magnesium-transporting ATPase (P-type)
MTQRIYDTIQGLLSYVILLSLAVALTFTIDYNNLLGANDLTAWGREFMPPFITTAWVIFALAVIAKAWGAWVQYRFWYRIDLANRLRTLADRLDPRR